MMFEQSLFVIGETHADAGSWNGAAFLFDVVFLTTIFNLQ